MENGEWRTTAAKSDFCEIFHFAIALINFPLLFINILCMYFLLPLMQFVSRTRFGFKMKLWYFLIISSNDCLEILIAI